MYSIDDIVKASSTQFLRYGIKSVAMDHIASLLSISKKTLYKQLTNKNELVSLSTQLQLVEFEEGLNNALRLEKKDIKQTVKRLAIYILNFSHQRAVFLHHLKKYYTDTYLLFNDAQEGLIEQAADRLYASSLKESILQAYLTQKDFHYFFINACRLVGSETLLMDHYNDSQENLITALVEGMFTA